LTTIPLGSSGMASSADTGSVVFTHVGVTGREEVPLPTRRALGPSMSLTVASSDAATMATTFASGLAWPRPFVISTYRPQSAVLIGMQFHQVKDVLAPLPICGYFAWCVQVVLIEQSNQPQAILEGLNGILAGWLRAVAIEAPRLRALEDVAKPQLSLDEVQHAHISFRNANCHSWIMPLRITETAVPIDEAGQPITKTLFHNVIITLNHYADKSGEQA